MKRMSHIVGGVCVLMSFCLCGLAVEAPLTYEKYELQYRGFQPQAYIGIEKLTDAPQGNWKLPKLVAKIPIYIFLRLGDSKCLMVIDQKEATDIFYNRLYFDANGNGDLTDDPAIDSAPLAMNSMNAYMSQCTFPLIDTTYQVEGKSMPYRFAVSAYCYYQDPKTKELTKEIILRSLQINVSPKCAYKGEIDLNGQKYQFLLGDDNGNGIFGEATSIAKDYKKVYENSRQVYPSGDSLYLRKDTNFTWYDQQHCSNKLYLEGKLYDFAISMPQGKMILTPTAENLCGVQLPMEVERLALYREDGKGSINVYTAKGELKIPAGNYLVLSYCVFRKDSMGDLWWLQANATVDSSWFTVTPATPVTLAFGEPYSPTVEIPKYALQQFKQNPTSIRLEMLLLGTGGDKIANISHISGDKTDIPLSERNKSQPKEPTYTISTMDGAIVAQGQFEYG